MIDITNSDPFADTKLGNALTRAIVDTIHEPFLVLNEQLQVVVASRSFYKKFLVTQEDTQGRLVYDIGNGQWDIPELRLFLKHIIPDHEVMNEYKIAHNFLSIGQRTMMLNAREIVHQDDQRKHLLLSIVDITDRELLELEKEKLSKQKDLMMQEMKHRIANSLQLIASILILKSEAVESPEVRTHLQDAHERIVSIGTIERYLDTTSLDEEVEVGPYLTGLCKGLAESMIESTRPVTLSVVADSGFATSAQGISLGLITAELVINALKHAFPDNRSGSVTVTYKADADTWSLSVADNGVGVTKKPVRKEGLGTSIVQSLAKQMGATVHQTTSDSGTTTYIEKAQTIEPPQATAAR